MAGSFDEVLSQLSSYIDENLSRAVGLIKTLTKIPSCAPENGGEGEALRAKALEGWLLENGFEEKNIEHFDAKDERVKSGVRPNFALTLEGDSRRVVWIVTHLDTVSAGDERLWDTPPFEATEKAGRLFGRGVEDNTQGLSTSVLFFMAMKACKVRPKVTLKALFVSDEEVGSKFGVDYMVKKTGAFVKGDAFIIPDGGDEKGKTIELAEKSILWLRFCVVGKEAHASRPQVAVNAALAGSKLAVLLASELEKTFCAKDEMFSPPVSTFSLTKRLSNNVVVNLIPGVDEFYFDARVLPCYKTQDVTDEVAAICKKFEKSEGVKVDFSVEQETSSNPTSSSAKVAQDLKAALKRTRGIDAKFVGIGGGTVAGILRRAGHECVVWSTLDERAHTYNEYCHIANIAKDAKTLCACFLEGE